MKATLVIMAAGLGSRYGGDKQVAGVGPNNEILMEYAIYDALRAGFSKVVFIIKPDMVELMPGLVTKAISAVSGKLSVPVIAGGMITEADEVAGALKAGALAVSTSDPVLWRMGV